MLISSKVFNGLNNAPLSGACIALYKGDCELPVVLGVTDAQGNFNINTPDTVTPLVIGYPGFIPKLFDQGMIIDSEGISILPDNPANNAAAGTGENLLTKKINIPLPGGKSFEIPLWVLLAVGAIVLYQLTKKKKTGKAVGAFDGSSLIVPGALLIGGYFLLSKLGLFGDNGTGDNNNSTAQSVTAAQANLAAVQAAGSNITYPQSNFTAWANDIFQQGTADTPLTDAENDAIYWDVANVNNLADWLALKIAFGTRKVNTSGAISACGLLGLNCNALDLSSFLKMSLNPAYVVKVNQWLTGQNINDQI